MVRSSAGRARGFTLVELACVLAMVLMLLCLASGLMSRAGVDSRAGVCRMNTRALAMGLTGRADEQREFSTAYVYGDAATGLTWQALQQQSSNPNVENGYIHWSAFLENEGWTSGEQMYRCPSVLRGGAPRTNPGPVTTNWEPGQINDVGQSAPGSALPLDRQVSRLAYTVNAAIMPRNLLTSFGTPRVAQRIGLPTLNDPIQPWTLSDPSNTILVTEFAASPTVGWMSLATVEGIVKSHRPITPFLGVSSGVNVFGEPNLGGTRYRYASVSEILPASQLGGNLWSSETELNAVGRHHAGGSAHFGHVDGSVRGETVQSTITGRRWGNRFWSMSGNNAVMP